MNFDYLFERANMQLEDRKSLRVVVCDRPGDGKKEEDQLLADLVDTFTKGTEYVKATHVVSNLLTTPSHLSVDFVTKSYSEGANYNSVYATTTAFSPARRGHLRLRSAR